MNSRVVWTCRVTAVALALLVLPQVFSSWPMTATFALLGFMVTFAPYELVDAASSMLGIKPRADRAKTGGPQ